MIFMKFFLHSLLPVLSLLVGITATPAMAQTALIAHRSHSGTIATFDATANENFGLPPSTYITDSVMRISDTLAVRYGQVHHYNGRSARQTQDTLSYNVPPSAPQITVEKLRAQYPKAKFLGFDSPQPPPKPIRGRRKRSTLVVPPTSDNGPTARPGLPRTVGVVAGSLLLLLALGWGACTWRRPVAPEGA